MASTNLPSIGPPVLFNCTVEFSLGQVPNQPRELSSPNLIRTNQRPTLLRGPPSSLIGHPPVLRRSRIQPRASLRIAAGPGNFAWNYPVLTTNSHPPSYLPNPPRKTTTGTNSWTSTRSCNPSTPASNSKSMTTPGPWKLTRQVEVAGIRFQRGGTRKYEIPT